MWKIVMSLQQYHQSMQNLATAAEWVYEMQRMLN